jgi:voltage-gated potassium channel
MATLMIFAVDYSIRFWLARKKRESFRQNIFDLIAIIPFSAVFSVLRIFRIVRITRVSRLARLTRVSKLARLIGTAGRLKARSDRFLRTNGLIYIVYLNVASVGLGAIAIYLLEKGVTVSSFGDAVWWAFVTATTVGYGDISPSTAGGRAVAAILMLFGIGLVSMLTGTIATYFAANANKSTRSRLLDRLSDEASSLSEEQVTLLISRAAELRRIGARPVEMMIGEPADVPLSHPEGS